MTSAVPYNPATGLFEDFNRPPGTAEAVPTPPPEPMFSTSDVETVRQQAWNEGYLAASRVKVSRDREQSHGLYADLVARSDEIEAKLEVLAEESAVALVRWLAAGFITAFPALAPEALAGRSRQVVELLKPALQSQVSLEVRCGASPGIACRTLSDLCRVIEYRLVEDLYDAEMVVSWVRGTARLAPALAWDAIRAVMMPLANDPANDSDFSFNITKPEHPGNVG